MLRTIASKHGRGEDEAFAAWERGGQLRTRCHDTAMTRIESTHTPILPVEKKVNKAARWVWIFCGHCSCQLVFPEAAAGLGRWQQQQHLIDLLFPSSQSVIRPRPRQQTNTIRLFPLRSSDTSCRCCGWSWQ